MSDTANAREPSMEDILASIRRIIDEEDTRDGRPAPDLAVNTEDDDRHVNDGPLPVMAAATTNREDPDDDEQFGDTLETSSRRQDGDDRDDDEESIFPERDSLFWSRATGRGDPVSSHGAEDDHDSHTAHAVNEPRDEGEDGDATTNTRADIFTRAQNKLEATSRLSARERIQSLAARAGERAEGNDHIDDDGRDGESSSDTASSHEDGSNDRRDDDVLPEFSTVDDDRSVFRDEGDDVGDAGSWKDDTTPGTASADVLELTDPIARSGGEPNRESGEDSYTSAFDKSEFRAAAEDRTPEIEETSATADEGSDRDDVFDLTTPFDEDRKAVEQGIVENGKAFNVSEIAAQGESATEATDIEHAISEHLGNSEQASGAVDETDIDTETAAENEPEAIDGNTDQASDSPVGNTYSRFDHVSNSNSNSNSEAQTADEGDATGDADADEAAMYSTAFTMLEDDTSAPDVPEEREEGFESAVEDEDADDLGDGLGFSDTYGASDVYHDDPPVFDEDYSRSLDDEDESVTAHAAFASDLPEEHRRDDLETVGGLVRDAMERDPVDYADPSALVSMTSEEISARALASLSDVDGEATRRVYGSLKISESGGSESLEGMVREMLRPMLSEWLDDNLPTLVESAVRNEVERISAKSRKYTRAAEKD